MVQLPPHALAQLSAAAITHVANLSFISGTDAAARLYAFNSQPLTPGWATRLPDAPSIATYLGLRAAPVPYSLVASDHWFHFRHPRAIGPLIHKLYVSTTINELPFIVAAAIPVFQSLAVASFKVGATLADLLRPDHLVVHLASPAERDHLARELARTLLPLAGVLASARGVPFTTAVADESGGLISSGTDPPEGGSHRLRLIGYLADALASAPNDRRARISAMRAGVVDAGYCPDTFEPRR